MLVMGLQVVMLMLALMAILDPKPKRKVLQVGRQKCRRNDGLRVIGQDGISPRCFFSVEGV